MFLIESSDGETMSMKPMNCPGHFLLYASSTHSYKELPIRFHEQTPLHRNEESGVLGGLTRVRQFSQDDGHCFVMPEQIGDEVERLLRLVRRVYDDLGMTFQGKLLRPEDRLRRHRRDRPQVAVRDDPARLSDAGAFRSHVHRRG
jgi:threonyl-tRNA synthetase